MPSVHGASAPVSGASQFEEVPHCPTDAGAGHSASPSAARSHHSVEGNRECASGAGTDLGCRGCRFQIYSVAKVSII